MWGWQIGVLMLTSYEVREKDSSSVVQDIADFINTNAPDGTFDLPSVSFKESGIIYCHSTKECAEVAQQLQVTFENY